MNRVSTLMLFTCALTLLAGPVLGDERYPHGRFYIGFDAVRSFIGESDQQSLIQVEESGPGAGLQFGYLLSPRLQLRLYSAGADHATNVEGIDLRVTGGILEIAHFLGGSTRWRPYLAGGVGGYKMESRIDTLSLETDGAAITFGAGCHYVLSRHFSLHASLRAAAINWHTGRATLELSDGGILITEIPVDESGSTSRLTFGLCYWF